MPKHSWERRFSRPCDAGAPVDEDARRWLGEEGYDPEDDVEPTPGEEFMMALTDLLLFGKISNKDVCTLCYWAHKAGIAEAEGLALRPGSRSGHFGRKVRSVLGHCNPTQLYTFEVPGHKKHDLDRTTCASTAFPLHEQLAKSIADGVGAITRLAEKARAGDLPKVYTEHPIVIQNAGSETPVIPVALFVDAVPYALNDSVLGYWGINVLSGERFLYAVARKKHSCRCGCRGFCSYDVHARITEWSVEAMSKGVYPASRHDGRPWQVNDSARASLAGTPMPCKFAVIYVKGDWAEFSHTLGYASWNDGVRPCFACTAHGPDMHIVSGNSPEGLRWHTDGPGDVDKACTACEIRVHVNTVGMRDRIAGKLRYDKRPGGALGRALCVDLPEYGLHTDDRLEPSRTLADVGTFDEATVPIIVTFWRRSNERQCRHRCRIFRGDLGTDPAHVLALDTLHTLYLGVMVCFCKVAIWALLLSGVYGSKGAAGDALDNNMLAMRTALMAFYCDHKQLFPADNLTQVGEWLPSMVGSKTDPRCKTKGAETWGILLFVIAELRKHASKIENHIRLLRAGESLERMVRIWQTQPWVMSQTAIADPSFVSDNSWLRVCPKNQNTHSQTLSRVVCAGVKLAETVLGVPRQPSWPSGKSPRRCAYMTLGRRLDGKGHRRRASGPPLGLGVSQGRTTVIMPLAQFKASKMLGCRRDLWTYVCLDCRCTTPRIVGNPRTVSASMVFMSH